LVKKMDDPWVPREPIDAETGGGKSREHREPSKGGLPEETRIGQLERGKKKTGVPGEGRKKRRIVPSRFAWTSKRRAKVWGETRKKTDF
jgi:hypothetical protein